MSGGSLLKGFPRKILSRHTIDTHNKFLMCYLEKQSMEYRPYLDAFTYSLAPTELQDRWNELDSYVYVISSRWDQKPATDKDF